MSILRATIIMCATILICLITLTLYGSYHDRYALATNNNGLYIFDRKSTATNFCDTYHCVGVGQKFLDAKQINLAQIPGVPFFSEMRQPAFANYPAGIPGVPLPGQPQPIAGVPPQMLPFMHHEIAPQPISHEMADHMAKLSADHMAATHAAMTGADSGNPPQGQEAPPPAMADQASGGGAPEAQMASATQEGMAPGADQGGASADGGQGFGAQSGMNQDQGAAQMAPQQEPQPMHLAAAQHEIAPPQAPIQLAPTAAIVEARPENLADQLTLTSGEGMSEIVPAMLKKPADEEDEEF